MGLLSKVTGALGLTADPNAGQGAYGMSAALQARAVKELAKVGIPEIEAQKLILEQPELVLSQMEERLGPSAMEELQSDPELDIAQQEALGEMTRLGEEGFSEEDKARMEGMRRQVGADEQARQASILSQMAQQGTLDSGGALAAKLASNQQSTQRAADASTQMAADNAAARRNALMQAGSMAGQMSQQKYGRDVGKAQAKDTIAQFNTSVSARDTAARQQAAQQKAAIANQQQMHNKGLIQQDFQNKMSKATGVATALGNQAQGQAQMGAAQASGAANQAAGMRSLVGTAASMYSPGKADGGVKYASGGVKSCGKAYEDGGEGTIIPGDNFAGDELPDRINSGEMVLNIDQQQTVKDKFKKQQSTIEELLAELSSVRGDEKLEAGMSDINPMAQEELMSVARGEMEPEEMSDDNIIQDRPEAVIEMAQPEEVMPELVAPIEPASEVFADGGVSAQYGAPDIGALLGELDALKSGGVEQPLTPEELLTMQTQKAERMPAAEPAPIEPAAELSAAPESISPEDLAGQLNEINPERVAEEVNSTVERPNAEQTDAELDAAKQKDMITNLVKGIDKFGAYTDAATVARAGGNAKPIFTTEDTKPDAKEKLIAKRAVDTQKKLEESQRKINEDYKKKTLELQEKRIESSEKNAKAMQDFRMQSEERKQAGEERKQAGETRRDDADTRRESLEEFKAARDTLKDNPNFKDVMKQSAQFNKVNDLIAEAAKGNQASIASLGTILARAMGEVGVLTDTDVVRYVGSTSWGRKLKDWASKGAKGELPKELLKDLSKNVSVIRDRLDTDMDTIYGRSTAQLSELYPNMEPKRMKALLGDRRKERTDFSQGQERGIQKVMDKNGVDRKTAINALKKAGKL